MKDEVELPSLSDVIEDPATSWWLRESLTRAMIRDPVDALNDALLLAQLLDNRLKEDMDFR
jgi:hypothetical protein